MSRTVDPNRAVVVSGIVVDDGRARRCAAVSWPVDPVGTQRSSAPRIDTPAPQVSGK